MFCVSNRQIRDFILLLFGGGCLFMLAAIQLQMITLPMHGKSAQAKSAWYETCQQQKRLLVASCVALPLYSSMLLLVCTAIADHLRFHVVGARMPLQAPL
eukprot:130259-Amphidinium_carterae.1